MAHLQVLKIFQKNVTASSASLFTKLTRFPTCTLSVRRISNETINKDSVHKDETQISKSVFISQSNDIFTNLALEDWLYKNFNFSNHHVMLLWINSPCVVIGRHQNPWLEANFGTHHNQEVQLARRNSGGGAVYHDSGNLNLTFFTPRERYNRKPNLELIRSALQREWGLKTEINKKEDLIVNGINKVSGTASKLGHPNSYHHCTLLVDVNKKALSESLHRYDRLISAIGWEYLRTTAISNEDRGWELVAKQRGFQMINPTDEWFPGLEKIRNEFESWEWRYGRTPKFTVTRSFPLPQHISDGSGTSQEELRVTVEVTNGLVEDVTMMIPPSLMISDAFVEEIKVMTNIRGRRFTEGALDEFNTSFGESLGDESRQFVADCVRKVMASV